MVEQIAGQRRACLDHDFHQFHLAFHQALQHRRFLLDDELAPALELAKPVQPPLHHELVAALQHGLARRHELGVVVLLAGDHDQPRGNADSTLGQGLAHQDGIVGHPHLERPGVQAILGSEMALTALPGFFLALGGRQQVAAEQRNEQCPGDQHAGADGREVEQAEGWLARLLQRVGNQQVGRCADQRGQSTQQAAVRQRHEQFRSRNPGSPGNLDDHRQHQRRHAYVVHEGREHTAGEHDDHGHGPLARTGKAQHCSPDDVGDARSGQPVAEDEHGPHCDYRAIGEPGHRVLGRDQAGHHQRAQHDERGDVHADFLGDEQHQCAAEDDQDQGDIDRHDTLTDRSEDAVSRLHIYIPGASSHRSAATDSIRCREKNTGKNRSLAQSSNRLS